MAFESRQQVRFADIDRAGIVYYPRFFDFWHRALEDFFNEDVKLPYHRLIDERRVGFPVVHVESDFRVPLQHGDVVTIRLSTVRLGGKSVTLRYRTFRPGQERVAAEGTITHACVDMDGLRAIALPGDVRAAFARHPTRAG
jgi:4-hydroxybenzoyl-CoA thioesterase